MAWFLTRLVQRYFQGTARLAERYLRTSLPDLNVDRETFHEHDELTPNTLDWPDAGGTAKQAGCVALDRQISAQNIAQHGKLQRLVENLGGAGVARAVDAVFDIAGGGPAGIDHHGDVASGPIRF